jgi:NAD(P)H-flavin reductase/hemoglobin-like flavoprotein
MTAEQLLRDERTAEPPTAAATGTGDAASIVRSSFALVAPQADDLARHFFAILFSQAPEIRGLFPVNMEVQRGRLLRGLEHVLQILDRPGELVPLLEQVGRDHRSFGVRPEHYDAIGAALLTTVADFAGRAWSPAVERAWNDAYRAAAATMRAAGQFDGGPATWLGRVVEHRRIGWDVAVVGLQTDEPVPYRAGQYLSVETPRRPRLWRNLSPANAPRDDGRIEFHVRAVPGGWVSRAIVAHSRIGDTWRLAHPMGRMRIDRNTGRELLMVAGGTGSAPIRALLEDLSRGSGQPRTQVFVGGRTWDDLYDFTPLRKLSYSNPWLDVIPVVERDDTGAGGAERGTLAEVVTRYGAWADHDVTVCGSPAMIRATVSRMLVAGTPLDRIIYDPFTLG